MSNGDAGTESRIIRVLSGEVAKQIKEEQQERAKEYFSGRPEVDAATREKIAMMLSDRKQLYVTDPWTESTFEEIVFESPDLVNDPYFFSLWNTFLRREMAKSFSGDANSLTRLGAMYYPAESKPLGEAQFLGAYFTRYDLLGPKQSGRLEEVIGPMGSGKSNFLAWKAINALRRGYVVFTNFRLANVPKTFQPNWHESHTLLDIFRDTVKLVRSGYNGIIFWILDEQGRVRGGSSLTRTTREGRYSEELLTMVRKFGVNITRARQADNIPDDQRSWVWTIVQKKVDRPDLVYVSYLMGGQLYEEMEPAIIQDMRNYYDTNEPAEFDYDLDTEQMQKYITVRGKEIPVQEAIMEFLDKSAIIRDKNNKAAVKKFREMATVRNGDLQRMLKRASNRTMGITDRDWNSMTEEQRDAARRDYIEKLSGKNHKESPSEGDLATHRENNEEGKTVVPDNNENQERTGDDSG